MTDEEGPTDEDRMWDLLAGKRDVTEFSVDGKKIFVYNNDGVAVVYEMSEAWDLSTAYYRNNT